MAQVLLERETVEGEAVEALLNNEWGKYLEKERAKEAEKKANADNQENAEEQPPAPEGESYRPLPGEIADDGMPPLPF